MGITLVLTLGPCACGEILGADTPEEVSGAEGGPSPTMSVDAARDAPVDAAPDRHSPARDAEAGAPPFEASGVALLVNPSQITFAPPASSAGIPQLQAATVINAGTAASPPITVSFEGDTTDFYVQQTSCADPLEADASCLVTIGALPSAAGQSSVLKVGGDGVYAFASITGPPRAGLAFEPPECNFGPVTGEVSCTLLLANTGNTTLPAPTFSISQAPGGPFSFVPLPPCVSPLLAGTSCPVTVIFDLTPPFPPGPAPFEGSLLASAGGDETSALLTAVYLGTSGDGGAGADAGTDATTEAGTPPPPPPPGTGLLAGADWEVLGITTQGSAILTNSGSVLAVSTGPAAPGGNVAPSLPLGGCQVVGNTVFVWQRGGGDLTVWTAASGAQSVSTSSLPIFATSYGQVVYFLDNWNVTTATADLVALPLGERDAGVGPRQVIATVSLSGSPTPYDPCTPKWQVTSNALYLGACVGGTGAFAENVWSFDGSGVSTPIATAVAPGWGADSNGDSIFVATSSGDGKILDATGSVVVAVLDTGVTEGTMLPLGGQAVYIAGGALRENGPPPLTAVTLAASAQGLWGLSPSGAYALYYDMPLTSSAPFPMSDVALVPTSGTPTSLALSPLAAPWTFTTDESHVALVTLTSGPSYSAAVASTSTGGTLVSLSLGSDAMLLPGAGAILLFQLSTSELATLDTSADDGVVIYPATNPGFAVTSDLQNVVYATSLPAEPGVFLDPIP